MAKRPRPPQRRPRPTKTKRNNLLTLGWPTVRVGGSSKGVQPCLYRPRPTFPPERRRGRPRRRPGSCEPLPQNPGTCRSRPWPAPVRCRGPGPSLFTPPRFTGFPPPFRRGAHWPDMMEPRSDRTRLVTLRASPWRAGVAAPWPRESGGARAGGRKGMRPAGGVGREVGGRLPRPGRLGGNGFWSRISPGCSLRPQSFPGSIAWLERFWTITKALWWPPGGARPIQAYAGPTPWAPR